MAFKFRPEDFKDFNAKVVPGDQPKKRMKTRTTNGHYYQLTYKLLTNVGSRRGSRA